MTLRFKKHRHTMRELAPDEIYFSAHSAKKAEAAHAKYLRRLGYNVRGGH